ncbi:MAG: TolC family protein [Planctomycetales bacterium]|nr:TolC family protein [Planctomycetales bacterium]
MLRLRQYVEHLRGIFTWVSDGCLSVQPAALLNSVGQSRPGLLPRRIVSAALFASIFVSGCSATQKVASRDLQWADGDKPTQWYKDHNTAIEHPLIDNETAESVQVTEEPRSLQRRVDDEVREMNLDEVILLALQNNKTVETSAVGGVGQTFVLNSPDQITSVYDSAIQETGVLFGRRGMEAALADFDTRFSTSMNWGRTAQGSHSLAPTILGQDTGIFRSGLDKSLASGGAVSVYHNWNYLGNDIGTPLYPSSYTGTLGAEVRQPLLAGAGTEFTRVAGPSRPGFGAIAGVSQGVVIARINQDITLADFERAVSNGLRTIEDYYWDLYFAYRNYDNAVSFHESAFETWRVAQAKMEIGTLKEAEELQTRDEFYRTRSLVETGLNQVYRRESDLRRALGLPMNDGTVLRPSMEPTKVEFKPDWESCLTNGLTKRVELRRQKWQVKSLQLQLNAARSLVRPQLDVVGNYGVNGFGDKLISQNGSSGYGSMTGDNLDTWTMGVEMSMPIGFRQARSQVKNYELLIARANAVLDAQERSIAHEIAISIQDVSVAWAAAQSNLNRLRAAERRVELLKVEVDSGTAIVDVVVRAQSSMADAERAYYEQLVAYNKAITYLNLSTGTLLEVNNVHLAEGSWTGEAYEDARLRADARTHAKDAPNLETQPREFASPSPTTSVERRVSKPTVQE